MSDWQWLTNNGIAVGVLVFLGTGMVAIARWIAPRIDRLVSANLATQEKLQRSLDRTEERADTQLVTCQEHVTAVQDTSNGVRSQNRAILELLHGARIGLSQANLDEQPRRQIEERLGEAERIIREAG